MTDIGEAFVKVRPNTAGFSQETKEGVLGPLKDVAKVAAGALAVGGATDFLVDAVKNASAFQERMAAVDATLKSSGQGTDEAKTKAENYVDALSKLSGFAKGDVAAALQRADLGTQNLGKSMQVETIAANLARKTHTGLAQDTILVTKAFAGNTTGLKRLGVNFAPVTAATDAYKEKVKELQAKIVDETGSTKKADEARLVALKSTKDAATAADKTATGLAVQAKLADLAKNGMKAYGETTAGKIALAKNAVEDLQIEIGTALLPTIGRLADIGTKEIERLQKGWPEIKKEADDAIKPLVPIFDTIRDAIGQVNDYLGGTQSTLKDIAIAVAAFVVISKTVQAVTVVYEALTTAIFLARNAQIALDVAMEENPVGLVVIALAALAAGIYLAYTRSATFRQIVQGAFAVLKTDVIPALQSVEKAIVDFVTYIRSHWSQISSIIGPIVQAAFALIKGYVQAPLDFVRGLIDTFGDVIHGRWSNIWGDLKSLVEKPLQDVETAVTSALDDLAPLAEEAAEKVATELVRGIKTAPGKLEGLAGDLLSKIKDAAGEAAGDAEKYGEKVGGQIADGVIAGLAGLAGRVASALNPFNGGGGGKNTNPRFGGTPNVTPKKKTPTGTADSFIPTPVGGQGSLDAVVQSLSIPDGSYANGELIRKGGKWYFTAGFRQINAPVPLKSDISSFVQKWVGSGVSPAAAKAVEDWWKEHFTNGKVILASGTTQSFQQSGIQLGTTLMSAIGATAKLLGPTLQASLTQQVTAAVTSARQSLTGLASSLAGQIGQVMDAQLSGTLLDNGQTVGEAAAKIAKDAADKQQAGLQSTLDAAKAASLAGPTGTNADGTPLTPAQVATQQAALNQAVTDAQNDLDDYLLQAKIDSATAQEAIAKKTAADQITTWTDMFNAGTLSQQGYLDDIAGLAGQYTDTGNTLGVAFSDAFNSQLATIVAQVKAITSAAGPGVGNNTLGSITNPLDAIIAQAVSATSDVTGDKGDISSANAAITKANKTYDLAIARDRTDATKAANDSRVYQASLAAANKQLDAANAAEKRDNAILAALRLIISNAGEDPDTVIAAAAR